MKIDTENIKILLRKPLGLSAQLKMAPQLRKKELTDYHSNTKKTQSAVLILLYKDNEDIKLILTIRSNKLRKHSGQISFPGGKFDNNDKDLEYTAFREAHEEIGLVNQNIEVLGWLSSIIIPVTNFEVHPLVAFSKSKPQLKINKDEVFQIITTSINDLSNPQNIKRTKFGNTSSKRFLEAPYFDIDGNKIWGATAMIISELLLTVFPYSNFKQHKMSFY